MNDFQISTDKILMDAWMSKLRCFEIEEKSHSILQQLYECTHLKRYSMLKEKDTLCSLTS